MIPTSPAMRRVLRSLRDGLPLALSGRQRAHSRQATLGALQKRGFIDDQHRPTAAGLKYLRRYDTN